MLPVKAALDALSQVIALLGVIPLFPHLDYGAQIAFVLALAIGLFSDHHRRHPVPPVAADLLALAGFLFYAVQIRRDYLVEPTVNLLVLLLALRQVMPKTGRQHLQIFALALFALSASSLVSLDSGFILFLALQVPAVITGLVLLTFQSADPRLILNARQVRRLFPVCLALPAATVPLLFLFFTILPRTTVPLGNFLDPTGAATAFAETVRPGIFAGLAGNAAVAFRAKCRELPASELYWRGIVLNTIEGHTWVRRTPPDTETVQVREGLMVRQTIYPEPRPGGYLPALDVPRQLQGPPSREAVDLVHTTRGKGQKRYEALSAVNGALMARGRVDRDFYLQVPAASERVRQAARRIAAGRNDQDKIARLQVFLRQQRLAYATTDLGAPQDPVDSFLFEKRRGYCEFFASASAVLLRLAGVPCRLVGGYLGGEYTDFGGYYTVHEEMAHVWLEALVDGREWVRLDPSRLAVDAPATLLAARERGRPWGRLLSDAVEYYWTRAVLTYDLERQVQFLRRLDLPPAGLLTGLSWLWLAVLPAPFGLLFYLRRRPGREERLLRSFLRRAERLYSLPPPTPGTGLQELAGRLPDSRIREFLDIYQGAVFRDRPLTTEERRKLHRLLRKMGKKEGEEVGNSNF